MIVIADREKVAEVFEKHMDREMLAELAALAVCELMEGDLRNFCFYCQDGFVNEGIRYCHHSECELYAALIPAVQRES